MVTELLCPHNDDVNPNHVIWDRIWCAEIHFVHPSMCQLITNPRIDSYNTMLFPLHGFSMFTRRNFK